MVLFLRSSLLLTRNGVRRSILRCKQGLDRRLDERPTVGMEAPVSCWRRSEDGGLDAENFEKRGFCGQFHVHAGAEDTEGAGGVSSKYRMRWLCASFVRGMQGPGRWWNEPGGRVFPSMLQ